MTLMYLPMNCSVYQRPFVVAAALCGCLLAGCAADHPAGPKITYTPPLPLISGDADRFASAPVPENIPLQFDDAPVSVPVWQPAMGDLGNDAATAGMTLGGMEMMQRLKKAQAKRAEMAQRLVALDAEEAGRAAIKVPPPELPAPADAAGAAAERKLATNLITREAVTAGAAGAERKIVGNLVRREGVAVAGRAAAGAVERKAAGSVLLRTAPLVEEGEGLGFLLRLFLFIP